MMLEILTPNGLIFNQDIDKLTADGKQGKFQVLEKHTDFLALLKIGALKVVYNGYADYFSVAEGVLEVRENKIAVVTEASENYKNIDVKRAKEAKGRAEKRLENKKKDKKIDAFRAEKALWRAINRLKLSKNRD